jgi:hypothetical protein
VLTVRAAGDALRTATAARDAAEQAVLVAARTWGADSMRYEFRCTGDAGPVLERAIAALVEAERVEAEARARVLEAKEWA